MSFRWKSAIVLALALGSLHPASLLRAQEQLEDTSAPQEQQAGAPITPRRFSFADLAAPFSRLRWGSWGLYSAQLAGGYSNHALVGSALQAFAPPGSPATQPVTMFVGSATMGFAQRRGPSGFSILYTPTFYQQSASQFSQANHSLDITYDRDTEPWRLSIGVHGIVDNDYGFQLQQHHVEPVARLQAPIGNQDLLNLIDPPTAFSLPPADYLITERRLARSTAGLTLSRQLGVRNSVFFSGGYGRNFALDAETVQGLLLAPFRSENWSVGMGFHHSFTPRHQMGLAYWDKHRTGNYGGDGTQRQVQLSYEWFPAPHWSLRLGAGPAVYDNGPQKPQLGVAANAAVAYRTHLTFVSLLFSRDQYMGSLPGAQISDQVSVLWVPRESRRMLFSVSSGYQVVRSEGGGDWGARGFTFRPTLAVPLNRSLQAFASYSYFNQQWDRGISAQGLMDLNRHLVLAGIRWNFELESRSKP